MVYKYHIYMCDPYDIYIIFLEGTLKKSEETKVEWEKKHARLWSHVRLASV